MSGCAFPLGGGVVSEKSYKKKSIARSTMKFDFSTLNKGGEKFEWLWNFLKDFCPKPLTPVCTHCES